MSTYAIITVGGKQYRVQEGQRLLVDRLSHAEKQTFSPRVLLVGGDGKTEIAPAGVEVTARVVEHVLGEKIHIGKYRAKTGYRRHTGFRSRLSQIEIESIGVKRAVRKTPDADEEPAVEEKPKVTRTAAKPKAAAKPRAQAAKETE